MLEAQAKIDEKKNISKKNCQFRLRNIFHSRLLFNDFSSRLDTILFFKYMYIIMMAIGLKRFGRPKKSICRSINI